MPAAAAAALALLSTPAAVWAAERCSDGAANTACHDAPDVSQPTPDATRAGGTVEEPDVEASDELSGPDALSGPFSPQPEEDETPFPNPAAMPQPPSVPDAPYACSGSACCDQTCSESDCVVSEGGLVVPDWWLKTVGFESCAMRVSSFYDATTPCSAALPAFATCGLKDAFACGYGLACVATNIAYSQCIPICSAQRFPQGFQSRGLERFWLADVTAGCAVDGQAGDVNTDGPNNVFVGDVQVRMAPALRTHLLKGQARAIWRRLGP